VGLGVGRIRGTLPDGVRASQRGWWGHGLGHRADERGRGPRPRRGRGHVDRLRCSSACCARARWMRRGSDDRGAGRGRRHLADPERRVDALHGRLDHGTARSGAPSRTALQRSATDSPCTSYMRAHRRTAKATAAAKAGGIRCSPSRTEVD